MAMENVLFLVISWAMEYFTMNKHFPVLVLILSACSTIKDSPKYQLSDGEYEFRQPGEKYKKAFVAVEEDTLRIFLIEKPKEAFIPQPLKDQYFLKRSFDVDVITIPFKYRPSTSSLPRQLTSDFNGNVFIGFRGDRFALHLRRNPGRTDTNA